MGSSIILTDNFKDSYSFEKIIDMQEEIISSSEELDLSKIRFIEPYSMLSLLLLGRSYFRSRGEKLKLINIPIAIHQYLIRMNFFEKDIFEVDIKLDEKYFLKKSENSRRLIEIIDIPNKERDSIKVITKIVEIFRKRASYILKNRFSESAVGYLITVISELTQNIFEHSLDSGYFAIQTYTVNKKNLIRFVISDSGIGIKRSFQDKKDLIFNSTAELIQTALTTHISSKRPFGYGLCQVNSIVEELKGSIYLRSEDASVSALYNKNIKGSGYMFQKNNLNFFDGTQISVTLSG